MQRRANQKYLLLALLPLLVIAAALWSGTQKKIRPLQAKTPVIISKSFQAQQHDVPLVSSDIPQISRAYNRLPLKNWLFLVSIFFALPVLNISYKPVIAFLAGIGSGLFKSLFPEHEFS